ncbi:MAG: diadenylate cyclase CdaA [Paludibacteraceae bacterium]|nr:diadenylate cyclase CdaA [Paludibacteraceae bacterium]
MLLPPISIKDIIDILLVSILLYQVYKILRSSGARSVFMGILAFLMAWFLITGVFRLELMGKIFNGLMSVGVLALIIIFQDEIRSFLSRLGSRYNLKFLTKQINRRDTPQDQIEQSVMPVVMACKSMSKTKTGALIVFTRTQELQSIIETGERIDAIASTRLVENIFFKNTPLHDGALIISNGLLVAAACVLPVSHNMEIPKHFGLRHRAALGLTEKTDAVAVVVSEETGAISYAIGGHIQHNVKPEELQQMLVNELSKQ